jgi:hypothetical protein
MEKARKKGLENRVSGGSQKAAAVVSTKKLSEKY